MHVCGTISGDELILWVSYMHNDVIRGCVYVCVIRIIDILFFFFNYHVGADINSLLV